jgi:hypothetical protein
MLPLISLAFDIRRVPPAALRLIPMSMWRSRPLSKFLYRRRRPKRAWIHYRGPCKLSLSKVIQVDLGFPATYVPFQISFCRLTSPQLLCHSGTTSCPFQLFLLRALCLGPPMRASLPQPEAPVNKCWTGINDISPPWLVVTSAPQRRSTQDVTYSKNVYLQRLAASLG